MYSLPTRDRTTVSTRLSLLDGETTPREPVTLREAREELRVSLPDEDYRLESLLIAARQWLEQQYHLALIPGRHRIVAQPLGRTGRIDLPITPVTEVLSVARRDADGESELLAETDWWADLDFRPARVWVRTCVTSTFEVTCRTGWTQITIPRPLKEAIIYRAWGYLDRVPTEDWMRIVRPAVGPYLVRGL